MITSMTTQRAQLIRSWVAATGIVLVLATWIFKAADGAEFGYVVLLAVLSGVPFLLYRAFMKTPVGAAITGALLLFATVGVYGTVFFSDSSTSAFGFIVSPVLNLLIVGVGGGLDSFLRRRGSHQVSPAPRSDETG